jgi:hypothetical protein
VDLETATAQPDSPGTVLEEMSPRFGWRSCWVNVALSEFVLLLLPGGLIVGAGWPRFSDALPALVITILVLLPVAMLMAWSQNASLRSKSGWVKYSDGKISTIADSNIHCVPLERCRWYYGSSTRATTWVFDGHPETGAPAILIEFPHECQTEDREWWQDRIPGGPVIAAVGFDAEGRQAWLELLRDCSAMHDVQREKMPSPLSGSIVFLLVVFLVPLSVIGVLQVSRLIGVTLTAMGIPNLVPCRVAGMIIMACIVFVLAYWVLFLVLYTRNCCVTPGQRAAFTKVAERYKIGFLVFLLFFAVLPLLNTGTRLVEELVTSVVIVLLTGLVVLHFRFLVKDPKSELTD